MRRRSRHRRGFQAPPTAPPPSGGHCQCSAQPAALGGHIDTCSKCGQQAISYNSCRNRHSPKCQAQARQRWLEARVKELLGVKYFHVVFTLPHELNTLCRRNARILYDLLFSASAAPMLELATNPEWLGARIGFISILHTWGQNLLLHPMFTAWFRRAVTVRALRILSQCASPSSLDGEGAMERCNTAVTGAQLLTAHHAEARTGSGLDRG